MRPGDRESATTDSDSYSLFGTAEPHGEFDDGLGHHSLLDDYDSVEADEGRVPGARSVRRGDGADGPRGRHSRPGRRGNRRFLAALALLLVVVVGVSVWLVVLPVYRYLNPDDYAGSGSGTVLVSVQSDDGASQIGTTLHQHDVVASVRAFTDAASDNQDSTSIQPGEYRMHRRMSAASAVNLLLDPSARVDSDVLVPEGATVLDVEKRLTQPQCTASSPSEAVCGAGLKTADLRTALANVRALGLPTEYLVNGKAPASAEGFLFPATYSFTGKVTATTALQQMISKFADEARDTGFTTQARALGISPYQALIMASLAQSEAKFADDYPKVARVILNRLQAHKPLQIDASTRYGAALDGKNPSAVTYSNYDTPYNTYLNAGLPPTPIANPGADVLTGAGHPATGKWMYYVNGDAAGHLVFLDTAAEFEKARQRCAANGWGCAK